MTTFPKRRARPVRRAARGGGIGKWIGFLTIALAFAGVGGFFAVFQGGPLSAVPKIDTFNVPGRPSAVSRQPLAVSNVDDIFVADDEHQIVHEYDHNVKLVRDYPVARNPVALVSDFGRTWVGHATGDITLIARGHTKRASVGVSITDLAFDGGHLWAADLGSHSLLEVDATKLRVIRRVENISAVRVIATDDGIFATTADDELVRYRYGHIARVGVGSGPIGLTYVLGRVWIADSDDGVVAVVDADRMRVLRRTRVGHGPTAITTDGRAVWVSNADDHTITRIDPKTMTPIGAPIDVRTGVRSMTSGWMVGTDPSEIVRWSE